MSKQYLQTHTTPHAHPTDIFGLAVTPSQLLSASGSSSIKVHSTRGQTIHADTAEDENPYPLAQTFDKAHPLGCHHITASADGKVAASAGFGGEVKVWDCNDEGVWTLRGQIVEDKKAASHWALALSPNGDHLATSTHNGPLNIYSTTSLSSNTTTPTQKTATYTSTPSLALSLSISPSGELLASGHSNGTVNIYNNTTSRLAHTLPSQLKPVRAVAFSPAEKYLAAAGDSRIITLYSTTDGSTVANFTGHASWIMSLDWNFSGELLLSGGYDGKAKIWSLERRECVATQTESEKCLWAVKWLPKAASAKSETLVTAGAGGTLAFYREASGT